MANTTKFAWPSATSAVYSGAILSYRTCCVLIYGLFCHHSLISRGLIPGGHNYFLMPLSFTNMSLLLIYGLVHMTVSVYATPHIPTLKSAASIISIAYDDKILRGGHRLSPLFRHFFEAFLVIVHTAVNFFVISQQQASAQYQISGRHRQ